MKKESIYNIFSDMPILKTGRLTLRKMSLDDTDDMYEYSKNPEVTKYLTWLPHENKAYTYDYLMYLQNRYKAGDFFDWAVVLNDTNKMIGTCGFTRFDFPNNSAEIGYVINPQYKGQGIATEASARVIRFGFENLCLERIECKFIVGNDASRKVMEKNGMIFEGVRRHGMLIKGEYRDVGVCSILKKDFFANM
jgi:ribosomal-protein-alanine N-acetyltransferase